MTAIAVIHKDEILKRVANGDKISDITPAQELGGVGVLVRTGYGTEEAARVPTGMAVVADLEEAARLILSRA